MNREAVARELVNIAKALVAAPSLPKPVKRWYDTFKKEGRWDDKKCLKEAIQRAFEENDISEAEADKLEKKHRVGAETPFGREGGQVKSVMKRIARKYGWDTSKVFLERDYSGYRIYGDKDIEDLPTIDMGGGRTRDDQNKELKKEAEKIKRELEGKLRKFDPEEIFVRAETASGGRGGKARLMIYVKFEEGVPVTPLQIL